MIIEALLLALGLFLLLSGGRVLVKGASELGRAWCVSEMTIGLTVVAFGTSAPEFAVNILAAVKGSTELAFGNVIGSNLANIGLVLGICAVIRPLELESAIVSREIPMMLLATAAALILGFDRIRSEPEFFDRSDGLMLLLVFTVFLYYSISEVLAKRRTDPMARIAAERAAAGAVRGTGASFMLVLLGVGLLLAGAQITVANAAGLAQDLGVPRAVIGLSIVAVGTSLPELATSVVAAWKGQTNLAVANVVGSNIFNLLFILGGTSVIEPVVLPDPGGGMDLLALTGFSIALLPLSRLEGARIVRWQGALMLFVYVVYVAWRFSE